MHDIHLVGNDTGGAVSQIVLTRDQTRFATFALTNCDTEGNLPPAAFKQDISAIPDDVIVDYLTPILGNSDGLRFMTALLSSMAPDQLAPITPLLRTCETPTAIIWGTGDIFFKRKWADWLVDLMPGATSGTEIPGGRLFFPDERAPELVEALNSHWNQNG